MKKVANPLFKQSPRNSALAVQLRAISTAPNYLSLWLAMTTASSRSSRTINNNLEMVVLRLKRICRSTAMIVTQGLPPFAVGVSSVTVHRLSYIQSSYSNCVMGTHLVLRSWLTSKNTSLLLREMDVDGTRKVAVYFPSPVFGCWELWHTSQITVIKTTVFTSLGIVRHVLFGYKFNEISWKLENWSVVEKRGVPLIVHV